MNTGEWTCLVCGALRPDARISCATYTDALTRSTRPPIPVRTSIRHCNDDPVCAALAPVWARAAAANFIEGET